MGAPELDVLAAKGVGRLCCCWEAGQPLEQLRSQHERSPCSLPDAGLGHSRETDLNLVVGPVLPPGPRPICAISALRGGGFFSASRAGKALQRMGQAPEAAIGQARQSDIHAPAAFRC